MIKVCIGLAIANLLIGIISGISIGFGGFLLGLLSGILSGGLYIAFAFIMTKLDEIQRDIRTTNERINTLIKSKNADVKCSVCGSVMSPDNTSCPRCGCREFIKLS